MAETPTALYATVLSVATLGNEYFVAPISTAGVFTFHVDTISMAAGDVLQVRAYQAVLSGATTHVMYIANYQGAQPTDDMIKVTPPIGNDLSIANSLEFSLLQSNATIKNFPWKVLQY